MAAPFAGRPAAHTNQGAERNRRTSRIKRSPWFVAKMNCAWAEPSKTTNSFGSDALSYWRRMSGRRGVLSPMMSSRLIMNSSRFRLDERRVGSCCKQYQSVDLVRIGLCRFGCIVSTHAGSHNRHHGRTGLAQILNGGHDIEVASIFRGRARAVRITRLAITHGSRSRVLEIRLLRGSAPARASSPC